MFDQNNPDDLLALKTEVNTDPMAYGYVPSDTYAGVLDIINLKRAEITVSKPKISASLVRAGTTLIAYDALLADKQEWLRWMTGSGGFDAEDMTVTDDLREALAGQTGGSLENSIWSAGARTEMEQVMLALIDVEGSRAEQLWGYGTVISRANWIAARDS